MTEDSMLMYKVSILVPVYGVEQYIERCARSLFEQTYPNLEFVFVNDCSPDRSIDVLKEVMKDYPKRKDAIRIVNHENNRGLAAARNSLLDNSSGDFIYCVDSDDWLEPNAVDSLMRRQRDGDADIVSGDYLVHYENGVFLLPAKDYKDKEQMVLQMMQRTWDHFVAGRMIRRSIFMDNKLRWCEGLNVAEDRYMMSLLAYHASVFAMVNRLVYHYDRCNNNAITWAGEDNRMIRNNHQELQNLLLLEHFFNNKETVFKRECARCVMEQLMINLQASLVYASKSDYYSIVRIIESRNDSDLKLIEWDKGIKGWIHHRYLYVQLRRLKDKVMRHLKKRKSHFLEN